MPAKAGTTTSDGAITKQRIVFWFTVLTLSSLTMIVGNKAAMISFHYPNLLLLMQNGFTVAWLYTGYVSGRVETRAFTVHQFQIFAVSACCNVAQIGSSFMALARVPIATVVGFRNLCTVAIAVIEWTFFDTKMNSASAGALFCVVLGMCIYAGTDYSFDAAGYFWLTVNSGFTVLATIWNRVFVKKFTAGNKIQTPNGVALIVQSETLPIGLFLAWSNSEFDGIHKLALLPLGSLAVIILTCFGGLAIGMAYSNCFAVASGTSVVVASTANKAVAIVLGMYFFGTTLTASQAIGCLICIAGALFYGVEQKQMSENKSLCDRFTSSGERSGGLLPMQMSAAQP